MFQNLKSIKISGRCFGKSESKLDIFPKESQRAVIIYGKNGSGKTTISTAFRYYANNSESKDLFLSLWNYSGDEIKITTSPGGYSGSKERIYVFNEEYVSENVGLKDDGLDTIVLFGKQVEVDRQIDVCSKELDELEEKRKLISVQREESYSKLIELKKKIEKKLRDKDGWAERERNILGHHKKSSVNDTLINDIYRLQVTDTVGELERQFSALFEQYQNFIIEGAFYPEIIIPNHFEPELEKKLISALSKKIEKVEFTDEDKEILSMLQKDMSHTRNLKIQMEQSIAICPYCFQKIDDIHRKTVLKAIIMVLNEDAENHAAELERMHLELYDFDTNPYQKLDASLCLRIHNQLEMVNVKIKKYNEKLEIKRKEIYKPVFIESLNLSNDINSLISLLTELQGKRIKHYEVFKDIENVKKKLILLNKKIAFKNLELELNEYFNKLTQYTCFDNQIKEIENNILRVQTELSSLKAKKQNIKISVDNINKALEYVFFSKKRMEVLESNGCYTLKSREADVKPADISCGEKNIIALCYFFSKIMEGLEQDNCYQSEFLLVIDDPISSFDYDNRIGIISYLKSQTSRILSGNPNSRIVFLTHDLYAYDMIYKFLDEIKKSDKQMDELKKRINKNQVDKYLKNPNSFVSSAIIQNFYLVEKTDRRQMTDEYSGLIKIVFEFACNKNTDIYRLTIGNIMRRLLEAFGTFEYQKGIVELSTAPELIGNIPEDKRSFFENLMYRFILHEESHEENRVNFADVDFYARNTLNEKVKTAQYILCLMYALNPKHVEMRLKNITDDGKKSIEKIKEWYANISE